MIKRQNEIFDCSVMCFISRFGHQIVRGIDLNFRAKIQNSFWIFMANVPIFFFSIKYKISYFRKKIAFSRQKYKFCNFEFFAYIFRMISNKFTSKKDLVTPFVPEPNLTTLMTRTIAGTFMVAFTMIISTSFISTNMNVKTD